MRISVKCFFKVIKSISVKFIFEGDNAYIREFFLQRLLSVYP